ncbi:MAG: hypothetical protein FWC02_01905 [Firmicutes bacterium]|nr:hypothetical protein [Bacillota bacterium]
MTKKDTYEKNILKKCVVCATPVMVEQFGHGDCENCKWFQNELGNTHPDRVIFPNLVSLEKAKTLVKQGKSLEPSFEDFIDGLFFYSEMNFDYDGNNFGLGFGNDEEILFGNKDITLQTYRSREEFMEKAHINGKLLKDIWDKVENPNYGG